MRNEQERRSKKMEREQTTIRLPKELKEELQREADSKGVSFNDYLMWLIDKARTSQVNQ